MLAHPRTVKAGWVVAAGLAIVFVAHGEASAAKKADRGFRMPHATHAEEGLDCTDCHALGPDERSLPDHDLCSMCHDIPEEADDEACAVCHTRSDRTVAPWVKAISEEVIFSHDPHLAQGLECAACHEDPDKARLPAGPPMDFCVSCHATTAAELNECGVCHTEIDRDSRPAYRGPVRIAHDVPALWKRTHGREYQEDSLFCAMCHEDQAAFCEDCHRSDKPDSHTLTWRRKTHGLRAQWDRGACAVCHEEDSCEKCHRNTEPRSHRGAWGDPLNRHCASCHYPVQNTNCTVCHEAIEHERGIPSPHRLGIYPPRCGLCHPQGLPHRAPHFLNTSVRCIVCH